jgi:antitoxin ParD1/3/4
MPTQNVNITDELESFVKTQITGGHFKNVSEVHRAALSLLARQEEERALRIERLRQEIQVGLDDVEAGRYAEYDSAEALFESITK